MNTEPMSNTPEITVIVPTHQRPATISKILEALSRQTFSATEFEVIVVLDGPCKETETLLREACVPYKLRWIVQPARGAPAARNLGVREASGPLLVFLDDDILPVQEFLDCHRRWHQQQRLVVFGGFKLSPESSSPIATAIDWSQRHFDRCSQAGYLPTPGDLPDGNFSASKEDILLAGGWDESITGFGGNDDRDLGLRLIGLGLPLHFDPKALGYHYQTKSWGGLLRDQRHAGRANQHLMLKCPDLFRDPGFADLRELGTSSWRAAAYQIVKRLPEFVFSLMIFCADRCRAMPKWLGRTRLVNVAVRGTGMIFYYRGLADPPRVTERVLQEIWGTSDAGRGPSFRAR